MSEIKQAERLPFGKKIIYAAGQFGWSLGSFAVMNLLYYFYDSNITAEGGRMFPVFIVSAAVLGVIAALSRVFDGVTDPLIAGLSDRSRSSFGRRRIFMAAGALPFALLSVLIFVPLSGSAAVNTGLLTVFTFLFYLFMTMYVTPFFALLSELGHSPDERLQLSTMISITWALGFMTGNGTYALQGMLEGAGLEPLRAFQSVIIIFAVVSVVLMYLPVIFIDEKRYCEEHTSDEGSFRAVASAFSNRNFLVFTLSDLTYFLALTFIQTGISFYIIQLLGMPKETATIMMTVLFVISFVFYVPVGVLARKTGKKKLLCTAFGIFILTFLLLSLWGRLPLSPGFQAGLVTGLAAIPMAIFGILPNAIVADIAEADGRTTGNFKAGVFFGARTFMSKLGASVTLLLFPFISHIGGEPGGGPTEIGIRITAAAGMIFLVAGLLLFLRYNEKSVLKTLDTGLAEPDGSAAAAVKE